MIDKNEIEDLASLCKLNLTKEETEKFRKDLNSLLDSVDPIKNIDTEGTEITYNVNKMINSLREEKVWESLKREEVLKNTSEEQYGYFKILKVVD